MAPLEAHLAVNLRTETIRGDFRTRLRPWGYLAPPSALGPTITEAAQGLRNAGRWLIVDNGNFDDLGRIANDLAAEASVVAKALTTARTRLGHDPRRSELSATVRERIDRLARLVEVAVSATQPLPLDDQLALNPSAVIGIEDITAATWLRVGLDTRLLANGRTRLRSRNAAVAKQATAVATDLRRRAPATTYYPVASAFDYETAFDAGASFANAGLRAASMGFGGFMADDRYADHITLRGKRVQLPSRMPLRYLRTALVARGFWDGWKQATGSAPKAFHFLGLGAPIMIGVVAVAAAGTRQMTFDATSPIRDAAEGTLYFAAPTYLKVRTRRAALRLASGEWTRWSCQCPFCRAFARSHPFDYPAGRAWFRSRGLGATVTAEDLAGRRPLALAYPLLSEPRPGALRTEVNFARAGHNHWMLQRILADLSKHGATRRQLEAHVAKVVDTYTNATASDSFADAVRTAFEIVRSSA